MPLTSSTGPVFSRVLRVLLCPAWKRWGTAAMVKADTTILHSRADDVVPFDDSVELINNSGLPESALIEVGTDHRLADEEPLNTMLETCDAAFIEQLRKYAVRLRIAIDRAKTEYPEQGDLPYIKDWPINCCDAPYLFMLLYRSGHRGLVRKRADVSHYGEGFKKHDWVVVDGIIIDISADQFPDVTDKVIVTRQSSWHDALPIIKDEPWARAGEDAMYENLLNTDFCFVYEKILRKYAPSPESV